MTLSIGDSWNDGYVWLPSDMGIVDLGVHIYCFSFSASNGSPSEEFTLERGLRQGDPLSHFLFLIAAEGLSLMMKKTTKINYFQPTIIGNDNVMVPHLQFADDTILMRDASLENARSILP